MKKILFAISMFLFITNVNALTFDVNLTNIKDEGNNGTIGSITNIDIPNKTVDAYFQDIGDEVSFSLTITNSGDRAGTLRSINVTSTNDKIEYTNNLPDGGLAINGNDSNTVIITGKVKEGAVNGTSSSEIKITYNYDEGSCPDGEILSSDESMCLCPEGLERNEKGVCIKPENKIECEEDEIYNETKKICEKKVVPEKVDNPKTLDNIILITLLFIVSGLGIYAVMFKKLKTNKKKTVVGLIVGVVTLGLSFGVLVSVFGFDKLLGAIVNPITKKKEIIVKVNETIDLIETWDGECSLDVLELTPQNIFEGGSGTEVDPYQVKTAEQLSCLAKSVNNGTTYGGKFIKQTKNIKLNDHLNDMVTQNNLNNARVWLSAGNITQDASHNYIIKSFDGTYDGDNHIISGLYLTNDSTQGYIGLFGATTNATFKNMVLSDVYMSTTRAVGGLIGYSQENLTINNVTTYGTGIIQNGDGAGLVSNYYGNNNSGIILIENAENNINLTCAYQCSGIMHRVGNVSASDEDNIIIRNTINNGNMDYSSGSGAAGILGYVSSNNANILVENTANTGDFNFHFTRENSHYGGIGGDWGVNRVTIRNSYNTGNWYNAQLDESGGIVGVITNNTSVIADNLYNSGDFQLVDSYPEGLSTADANAITGMQTSVAGIFGHVTKNLTITNSYNTGDIEGYLGYGSGIVGTVYGSGTMENCYNTGNITGAMGTGGLTGVFGNARNPGIIRNSYNTGDIITFADSRAGGLVGWSGPSIYNSYNTGDIYATGETTNQVGGLCAIECPEIKNSYNTGNITAKYFGIYIAGIAGGGGTGGQIVNTYNAGNITYLNVTPSTPDTYKTSIAGISGSGYSIIDSYNLGDITIYQNGGTTGKGASAAGIAYSGNATSCVNTGNIKVIVTAPYTQNYTDLYLDGIVYMGTTINGFNAGKIEYDDSALDTPLINDGYERLIQIGEIVDYYNASSTGNKFTNPNGYAVAQYTTGWQTLEQSLAVGQYTTDPVPSVLSIINDENAFEVKSGETLPTLKVFNN